MTVEFIRKAPVVEKRSLLGLRRRKVTGEAPKPIIARPSRNDITNVTSLPTRSVVMDGLQPDQIAVLQVISQDSTSTQKYQKVSGRMEPVGEPEVLVKEKINDAGMVSIDGEEIAWRKTQPGEPEFSSLKLD